MYLFRVSLRGLGLIFLMSWAAMSFGQQITITGEIRDSETKEPLSGVKYVVTSLGIGGYSDDDGVYVLKMDYQEKVDLTLSYVSYADTTITIEVPNGEVHVQYNIKLMEEGVNIGTQVIVAGLHKQDLDRVTASVDVVTPEKVDYQASNEIEDVLQQTSGVDIIDGQPNIRGSSGYAYGVGSRVMVMLDGLPLLAPHAAFPQFDLIPMDNIEQIEVMKGASSVLYGSSALGGVINVVTKDAPETPKTSVRLTGSYYDSPRNPAMDWDGNAGAKVGSVNLFHTRRIGNHDFTLLGGMWKDTGYRKDTDTEEGRIMLGTKFRPKNKPGLTIGVDASARFDSSTTFLFWDGWLDTLTNSVGEDSIVGRGLMGDETLRRQFNSRFTLDPSIKYLNPESHVLHAYNGRIMRVRNINDTGQDNKNWMFYNKYQMTRKILDDRVTWITGVQAQFNTIDGDSLFSGDHYSFNGALFTQFDAAVNEKLTASFGARFDYFNIDGDTTEMAPIFRLGLNYQLAEGTFIRGSFGQAFRSPSIAERFTQTSAGGLLIQPNPGLQVEKGFSAELGIRQGIRVGTDKKGLIGFVDLAAFVMDFKNMIEFGITGTTTPNPLDPNFAPIFSAINISRATVPGVELTGLLQYTNNKFRFDLSGGVTRIEPFNPDAVPDSIQVDLYSADDINELFDWLRPAGDPQKKFDNPEFLKYRSRWTNRASVTVGYGKFSFTTNYRSKSEVVNIDQVLFLAINGAREFRQTHSGGFQVFDFILGYEIMEGMTISGLVKNAFNEEYAVLPGILEKQRQFSLQYKWVF